VPAELFGGNGIVMDYGVIKFFAVARGDLHATEGTREMNTSSSDAPSPASGIL